MASRVGILHLPRQVLYQRDTDAHVLPSNGLLPPHQGMVITRALQEWACLLPGDLPFEVAQRLLSWTAGETQVVCTSEVRLLVRQHGKLLQAAEEAMLQEGFELLLAGAAGRAGSLPWVSATPPRRLAAWPPELDAAVAAALAQDPPQAPEGVRQSDWERVLAARQQERPVPAAALCRLGPVVPPGEVVACVDEVLVRTPERGRFGELRTARVAIAGGYRYLCGTGEGFLKALLLWLVLAAGREGKVTLLADGGRWIATFFEQLQAVLSHCVLRLDWYHLAKKCRDRLSRLGGSRAARKPLLQQLLRPLWQGDVAGAVAVLEDYRPQACHPKPLEELQGYLREHQGVIPNYRQERAACRYIGSGQGEKANDLLVARRQKRRGMHWNLSTSEALARLKMLQLNHEWDAYWQYRQLPSLLPA